MVLENVFIIPHGDEIISQPNEESKVMYSTIKEATRKDESETVVIISPHSIRLKRSVPVINTEHLKGYYRIGNTTLRRRYDTDRTLIKEILINSNVTEEVNFVTSSGNLSIFPIDFGSLIPLTFFGPRKLIIMGQWRDGPRDELVLFGRKLFKTIQNSKTKITMIFSADQAHTHNEKGPYGYSDSARKYDKLVIQSLKENEFEKLFNISKEILDEAKPDSYWNMLSFFGFVNEAGLVPEFKYYYLEKYFGMIFATAVPFSSKGL